MTVTINGKIEVNVGQGVEVDNPQMKQPRRPSPIDPIINENECGDIPELDAGLPVLLARPALMPRDFPVEELGDDFLSAIHDDYSNITPADMRYGLRLLRPGGYLYVIDENQDNPLSAYQLTEDGGVYPLEHQTQNGGATSYGCSDNKLWVTIPNAKEATKPVWFAYSDVEWTESIKKSHLGNADIRASHMTPLDIQQWLNNGEHPGVKKMKGLADKVAELWGKRERAKMLEWSPFSALEHFSFKGPMLGYFANRQLRESDLPRNRGALVALPDPTGVTADLAAMMQYQAEHYVESLSERSRRQLAVSQGIDEIEFVVKENAENELAAAIEKEAQSWESEQWHANSARQPDQKEAARIRASLTSEQLDETVEETWADYRNRFNSRAQSRWQEDYSQHFAGFNENVIAPLALTHRAWMESDCLNAVLEHNFDPEDPESGAAYTATVTLCIGSSQDKGACFDLYSEWLEAESDNNPLRRALAYNQDSIRQEIAAAITPGTTWEGVPWDKLVTVIEGAAAKLGDGESAVLGQLIAQVAGPIEKLVANAASSGKVYAALGLLGAAHGQPFVLVEVSGRGRQFWSLLAKQMIGMSGQRIGEAQLRQAVLTRLRRLAARGLPMEQAMTNRWLLMIDPEEIRAMPANLKGAGQLEARAAWLASHIKTPEQVQQLNLAAWQDSVHDQTIRTTRAAGTVGLGILGLLTQHVALSGLQGSLMDAMSHQKAGLKRRLASQWMQITGAYGELLGRGVEALGKMRFRMARAMRLEKIGIWLKAGGRALGVVGSVVMAVLDFHEGWTEFQRGNRARAAGYVVLGGMGLAFLGAMTASTFGIGLVLFLAILALSLLLDYFKPDDMQLWLERCIWGSLEEERYENARIERKELQQALRAQ